MVFSPLVLAGQRWPRCQAMKFSSHAAESFRTVWRLRGGCQALQQLCLPEAAGRVGASAHFSVSEPRLFKRAPVVLITHSLGVLTHSTQHTAHNTLLCMCESTTVHVGGGGGGGGNSRTHLSALVWCWLLLVCNRLFGRPPYYFQHCVLRRCFNDNDEAYPEVDSTKEACAGPPKHSLYPTFQLTKACWCLGLIRYSQWWWHNVTEIFKRSIDVVYRWRHGCSWGAGSDLPKRQNQGSEIMPKFVVAMLSMAVSTGQLGKKLLVHPVGTQKEDTLKKNPLVFGVYRSHQCFTTFR